MKAWKPHDSRVVAAVATPTTKLRVPFKYDSEGIKHVLARVGKLIVIVSPWENEVPPCGCTCVRNLRAGADSVFD